jgi:hypothetical protein
MLNAIPRMVGVMEFMVKAGTVEFMVDASIRRQAERHMEFSVMPPVEVLIMEFIIPEAWGVLVRKAP